MATNPYPFIDPNSEEYKEFIKKMSIPYTIWGYNTSIGGIYSDKEESPSAIIPFEQDENGFYGYKTLIRIPESQWFWSPNRFHYSVWIDNCLTAHVSPQHSEYGIYGTKDLESLREWYDAYKTDFNRYSQYLTYAVKIRVWGCVVEHTTGFRAEHAEIVEVLNGYR